MAGTNEAGLKHKLNEEMANDSISESFAIRVFAKMSGCEPDTPTEKYVVKTL
ncbi:hypothetical protein [Alkalicoccobacillus gibsonii]|uniref:hypothetical protein n=1 Tax=Alkalicoccobacillus gibsonii TaxID=79881 RepID=UPI0023612B58|nr:hypothetical protein [Alkalicoccobacillus gibsonii]